MFPAAVQRIPATIGLVLLLLPVGGAPATAGDLSPVKGPFYSPNDIPTLTLTLRRDGAPLSEIRIGLRPEAHDGRDAFDVPASESAEPPTLRLAPRVGGNPSAASPLIAEFRSSEASGHTFSLVLRTDADGPVTLHATGLNSFSEQTVFLVDPSAGASHNLRRASAPTIRPQNESHTLHLLVGTAAYVEAKKRVTLPRTVQFLPPSPNPFGRRATLTYVLPSPGPVRLVVYDLLGRRVRVLVDRRQQAGRHTVTWHGRDPSGRRVASGVYLARLSASSVSKVRKMTFVR